MIQCEYEYNDQFTVRNIILRSTTSVIEYVMGWRLNLMNYCVSFNSKPFA